MEFRKDKMIFLKDDGKHTFMLNGYYPAGQSEYKTAQFLPAFMYPTTSSFDAPKTWLPIISLLVTVIYSSIPL